MKKTYVQHNDNADTLTAWGIDWQLWPKIAYYEANKEKEV